MLATGPRLFDDTGLASALLHSTAMGRQPIAIENVADQLMQAVIGGNTPSVDDPTPPRSMDGEERAFSRTWNREREAQRAEDPLAALGAQEKRASRRMENELWRGRGPMSPRNWDR